MWASPSRPRPVPCPSNGSPRSGGDSVELRPQRHSSELKMSVQLCLAPSERRPRPRTEPGAARGRGYGRPCADCYGDHLRRAVRLVTDRKSARPTRSVLRQRSGLLFTLMARRWCYYSPLAMAIVGRGASLINVLLTLKVPSLTTRLCYRAKSRPTTLPQDGKVELGRFAKNGSLIV
jgi:hypothetical protein